MGFDIKTKANGVMVLLLGISSHGTKRYSKGWAMEPNTKPTKDDEMDLFILVYKSIKLEVWYFISAESVSKSNF